MHVSRQREDFQNKLVSRIFKENDALILEKLSISGMLRNHTLAKPIFDAAWGKFARKAIYKAEMLGKYFITVDPWGTTQFCYNCLTWVPKELSIRQHVCPNCGLNIPRDVNSGRLIKRLGILSSPPSDGGSSLAEPRPLPSLRGMVSRGTEAGSH
jgi:putative transposase